MQYGIHIFATEKSIRPGELARSAEERGFESVWFSEHTHISVSFLNSNEDGRKLPDYYWQTYDVFIAATLAAAATKTIKIGTGVCLVVEHDTITLAKAVATIDQVSEGRFIFGIGSGWLAEEMQNHGVKYPTRYRLLHEQVAAMKQIWSEDEAEFQGELVKFTKMKAYPKPIQKTHPPIIGGGATGPKSLDFLANNCDGWMPILGMPKWPEIKAGIPDLKQRAKDVGRDPDSIEISIFTWTPPDEETLVDMQASGVKKIVISLEAKSREESLPLLDEYAKLVNA
ncbi:MAG: TIGR03619 family F420-dependent LLM class oxidoreductase [Chloroflexi bacterium]|nr:TIGR03619 family F420-dependent LLM class oxidoreductase [Chloroflexota bacterium]